MDQRDVTTPHFTRASLGSVATTVPVYAVLAPLARDPAVARRPSLERRRLRALRRQRRALRVSPLPPSHELFRALRLGRPPRQLLLLLNLLDAIGLELMPRGESPRVVLARRSASAAARSSSIASICTTRSATSSGTRCDRMILS